MTYTANDKSVYLLHVDSAVRMTDEEIISLLGKSVLTDSETVEYLYSRGFDLGFEMQKMETSDRLVIREKYTDNP